MYSQFSPVQILSEFRVTMEFGDHIRQAHRVSCLQPIASVQSWPAADCRWNCLTILIFAVSSEAAQSPLHTPNRSSLPNDLFDFKSSLSSPRHIRILLTLLHPAYLRRLRLLFFPSRLPAYLDLFLNNLHLSRKFPLLMKRWSQSGLPLVSSPWWASSKNALISSP